MPNPKYWNNMTRQLVELNYGRNLLSKYGGSLVRILEDQYPSIDWNASTWNLQNNSHTRNLVSDTLKSILCVDIELEWGPFNSNHSIQSEEYGDSFHRRIRFDIWIPQFNIAIEYHVFRIDFIGVIFLVYH
jgi:hypothetical protein